MAQTDTVGKNNAPAIRLNAKIVQGEYKRTCFLSGSAKSIWWSHTHLNYIYCNNKKRQETKRNVAQMLVKDIPTTQYLLNILCMV